MPNCPGTSASRKPIWGPVMANLKMAEAAAKPADAQVLSVSDLQAWYGESHILHGINFNVKAGEVVTLLGRNGAGKTTTLKSVMGIIGKRTGSIRFDDQDITRASSDRIARMGVAFCPEERGIFASLDVRENLLLPPIVRPGGLSLDQIFELFPNLKERLNSQGTKLSGGEQQMLAIARILRTGARFLMLDEPTEGLAPVIIQQIGHTIARLKSEGFHHPAGRAEFPLRLDGGRPLLHRRARQGHRRFCEFGAAGQYGQAPHLSRRLIDTAAALRTNGDNMKHRHFGSLARRRSGGCRGRRPGAGQEHQDRRSHRQFRTLFRPRRRRLDAGGADGDRGFRPGGQGLEDRPDLRRPPEQARHRHQHRAAMDRRREGRHLHGRAELRRCAGGQQSREGKEFHHDQYRRGDVGSDQRPVLAEHNSLGLRHLHARQQHRSGAGEGRRRYLVLPDRGLRLRPRAGARHHRGRGEVGRQGYRQRQASAEFVGLLLVPAAGAGVQGQDRRHGERRRRHHQHHQAGVRVRHRRGRPETRRPAAVHHRRALARSEGGAGAELHRDLLLGPERRYPRVFQALLRAHEEQGAALHGAGRRLFRPGPLFQDARRDGRQSA